MAMKKNIFAVVLALLSAYLLSDWAFAPSQLDKEHALVERGDATYTEYKGGELYFRTEDDRITPIRCDHIQALCEAARKSKLTDISVTFQLTSLWQGRWLVTAQGAGINLISEVEQARKYSGALSKQLSLGAGLGLAAILLWLLPMPTPRALSRTAR